MYATDYDDRLPPTDGWTDKLQPYMKRNPADLTKSPKYDDVVLGMNRHISAVLFEDVWDGMATVMLAEMQGQGVNQVVDKKSARPDRGRNVAFMDGFVRYIIAKRESELIWIPDQSPHDEVDDQSPGPATDQE